MVISYDTGKNQDHRPGKPNPTKRNATSAPQQETQPPLCRPRKGDQKKSSPRKEYTLDLKTLKEKDYTEVVHTLNASMARFKFFLRSEQEQHNSDDFIFDLTCTLAIVCDAPANENTNKILAALKGSAFFSSKIGCLLDRIQKTKTVISNPESQRRLIECLIKVFNTYLRHLPSSYADPPYDLLRETLDQTNIDENDDLKNQLGVFKKRRDDIIKAEREKHGRRYTNKAGQKPPNDFRDMPICPTNEEIKSREPPFLRANIKKGRYEDVEHYLDVQFRLLREDFLEPLRDGIYEITHNIPRGQRNQLMKCYQGVHITGKELTLSGVIYKVEFDVSKFPLTRWAHSKRLIFGSFLCFSKDNFETMLFATVANRDPKDLQEGRFDIKFIEEQNIFDIEKRQQEYQMVESPAFFEAYRHVLAGLKGLNEDSMPFTKYLVECSAEVDPPEYLRRDDDQDPVCYDLSKALDVLNSPKVKNVPVLKPEAWPSVDILPLNRSQLEALRTAVATEFSVIQGPPGTGKTYVGAKIVRCLLENREQWDPEKVSPMLMVCYTNHALDQFLEKVLEFLPKREIIRVGGRSKSEELEDCNVKVFTKKYRRNYPRSYTLDEIRVNEIEMALEMGYCKKGLDKANKELLEFQDLETGMTSRHADQFYGAVFPRNATTNCQNPPNTFKLWLCNNTQMNDENKRSSGLLESQKNEGQDGSILQDDNADEDDGVLWCAAGARFDVNTNSDHFRDEPVEDGPKENVVTEKATGDTGTSPIPESDQSQSTNTEDRNQLKENTSYLNGTSMNMGSKPKAREDLSSSNQSAEQSNVLEALQRSLDDDSQLPVAKEVEESTAAKQLEDKCHLLNVDNESDPLFERPDTEKQESKEEVIKPHEADEETIAVEDEAAWIQNQRFIEGEEDYTLVRLQQSDRGKREKENDGEVNEDTEELQTFTYQKNVKPFVWKKEESGASNEQQKEGRSSEAESSQRSETATKRRKRKRKKTESKINLTANVSNIKRQLQKEMMMPDDEAMRVENIWFLSARDRLRLYLYWVESYRERHKIELQRCEQHYEQKHKELCFELEEIKAQEEEEVIRRATVVGMTTSGAARYHSMLQRISPKIVIIEEAAEVMEAHIITSLSRDTKHTILIGDHKQLRPKATVYELAQKYNLEISLFERMVLNSMDCKRLCIQHRMRPEIAALTKRIYEHEIVDHESVCKFDDISGLKHNMFFIDHCQPEVLVGGMQSFSNPHEAAFLVALCRYLLLQGYKREQITILTMYTGQLLELKNRMPRSQFEGIKVCVVDNFQGEENDIILLSLVRSNSKIGFLKESNRICVALSRAREGFYCIGNFALLKSQCMLWKEICDDLETKNAIGQTLTLVCKRHNNVNEVRNSSDIQKFPLGGCDKICGERLDCGHACDRSCHPTNNYHQPGQCPKVCWKSCPNEHQCQRRCHHPLDCLCPRPMVKIIPRCGHEQTVQCCTKPEDFVCPVKCEKTLDCGHRCKNVCGNPCTRRCTVDCKKTLPCGHEKVMPCFKDPIIRNQCNRDCEKVLDCGHRCSKKCQERCHCNTSIEVELPCKHRVSVLCPKKDQPPLCFEKCNRELPCGHECPGLCHEECSTYRCRRLVEKPLPCYHTQIIPCHVDTRDIICREQCDKECTRGHSCQRRCHFGVPCKGCNVMVNMTIPSCKHNIEMPCFLDPATIACKKPCERVRYCGHACRDVCGKNCEDRPCMRMVPKTLPCGHTEPLACNKKPETYKCKTNVVVDLPCGHKKIMYCYAKNAGLENVLCNVKVEKELSCKHNVVLECHIKPEEYKCKKKVGVKMTCGHTKSVICSIATAGMQETSCVVLMTRKLPCEHEVTIPCSEIAEEYICQERVDVALPCGHKRSVVCSKAKKVLEDEKCHAKCDAIVRKKLRCGHEKDEQCFVKPEDVFCDAPCEQVLSCEHLCRGRCGDDCTKLKCAVTVVKDLACGYHEINCLCSDDVSLIICPNKCKRKLPCGHSCVGKCTEKCSDYRCEEMMIKKLHCPGNHYRRMLCYKDPQTVTCLKKCKRKLDCGHPCNGICGQPCETIKCMQDIEMTFHCGHKKWLSCFTRKVAICGAPCLRPKGSCEHLCKGLCGEPCTKYPCDVPVTKTLRCGHKIEMRCCQSPESVRCPAVCRAKLQCGHQCSGTCSDCWQRGSHESCQHPCGRFLICLHRCRATCCVPCPPCVSTCSRRCPHEKCKHPCSKPCKPCTKPCTWSCPHYPCNNLCGEECDHTRCDAPCPKKLPCGHPCIGLCGETCPTMCGICHARRFCSILADARGNEKKQPVRCLQLFDCGHIIKVEEMDAWMMRQQSSDIQLMRCPRCSTSITFSYRYGNFVKRTLKNIETVKAQVQELAAEVSNSVYLTGKDLKHLKYDVRMLKFPQTVFRAVQPFSFHVREIDERNILFLFTLKNHFMILKQALATQQVLANVHSVQATSKQQLHVDELLNITTNALENIKEYLEQPRLDLKTLSQVHEHTRKFFLFSHVLECQTEAAKHQTTLTRRGKTRLKLVRDRFAVFLQGNNEALDLQWLEEIVNLLRKEVHLPLLSPEEIPDFANFPGCQRGVWKSCDQGHVYFTGGIVRGGKEIPVGSQGCNKCTAIESDQ